MFEKWLLAHFTRLARLMHALFLYKIYIGSLRRWWGLGWRNRDLGWPKPAGSPRKQALIVSMNVVKLMTILITFGLSCYKLIFMSKWSRHKKVCLQQTWRLTSDMLCSGSLCQLICNSGWNCPAFYVYCHLYMQAWNFVEAKSSWNYFL